MGPAHPLYGERRVGDGEFLMGGECSNCAGGIHALCVGPSCDCGCPGSRRPPTEAEIARARRVLGKAKLGDYYGG